MPGQNKAFRLKNSRAWSILTDINKDMIVYLGADHRGLNFKSAIAAFLKEKKYPIFDMGAYAPEPEDDYPDMAAAVAAKISEGPEDRRGVLICGSGVGVCVTANKFPRVRAALAMNVEQAMASRSDDNANILCLASDFISESDALRITEAWLAADFSGAERHVRRLEKIAALESQSRG